MTLIDTMEEGNVIEKWHNIRSLISPYDSRRALRTEDLVLQCDAAKFYYSICVLNDHKPIIRARRTRCFTFLPNRALTSIGILKNVMRLRLRGWAVGNSCVTSTAVCDRTVNDSIDRSGDNRNAALDGIGASTAPRIASCG